MTDRSRPPSDHTSRGERSTIDQLFDALSHQYRLRILTTLAETSPYDEVDVDPADFAGDGEPIDDVRIGLHHNHLPRLDETNFVDWDREAGTVRRGPRYEAIAPTIELLIAHQEELPVDLP